MKNWNACSNNHSSRAQRVIHPFAPVWDRDCRILILGSFPSVKSREQCFYYGHPQNRFWRVIAAVYNCKTPITIDEKREILLQQHIALWDVIQSCKIIGSSDSSISEEVPNDLRELMKRCSLDLVVLNGKTADRMYQRYWKDLKIHAVTLPSTSPANAAWSFERLTEAWKMALTSKDDQSFPPNTEIAQKSLKKPGNTIKKR